MSVSYSHPTGLCVWVSGREQFWALQLNWPFKVYAVLHDCHVRAGIRHLESQACACGKPRAGSMLLHMPTGSYDTPAQSESLHENVLSPKLDRQTTAPFPSLSVCLSVYLSQCLSVSFSLFLCSLVSLFVSISLDLCLCLSSSPQPILSVRNYLRKSLRRDPK